MATGATTNVIPNNLFATCYVGNHHLTPHLEYIRVNLMQLDYNNSLLKLPLWFTILTLRTEPKFFKHMGALVWCLALGNEGL